MTIKIWALILHEAPFYPDVIACKILLVCLLSDLWIMFVLRAWFKNYRSMLNFNEPEYVLREWPRPCCGLYKGSQENALVSLPFFIYNAYWGTCYGLNTPNILLLPPAEYAFKYEGRTQTQVWWTFKTVLVGIEGVIF